MNTLILRADVTGAALGWINHMDAAGFYARDRVAFTLGDPSIILHGGINARTGLQSIMRLHPVIFTHGRTRRSNYLRKAPLTRRALFRRDANLCLYCGKQFKGGELSIDHVLPTSRGGRHKWTNVVSSCRRCNTHKANRTPEEAGMDLIAVPYEPNYEEFLLLAVNHRTVLADQMDYLLARCPERKRLWI